MFARVRLFALAAGLVGFAADARASNISSATDTAFGNQLAGATVTVRFGDGTSQTVNWVAGVGQAGSASGTGWTLALTGDTFTSRFNLTNSRNIGGSGISAGSLINQISINLIPSNGAFDQARGPFNLGNLFFGTEGTLGSNVGTTFDQTIGSGSSIAGQNDAIFFNSLYAATNLNATGTYGDPVTLMFAPPVGDMFGNLTIDITRVRAVRLFSPTIDVAGIPGAISLLGSLQSTVYSFNADTDLVVLDVPEPATMALFGMMAVGAGVVARRRKLAKA